MDLKGNCVNIKKRSLIQRKNPDLESGDAGLKSTA